jgi:hypothetical protein
MTYWQKRPPMHCNYRRWWASAYGLAGRIKQSLELRRENFRVMLKGSKGSRLP